MEAKEFYLEILTPDRTFFKGSIESLVVNTLTGEMGILYQTLPTVAMLSGGTIKICQKGKWTSAVCGEGFIDISREGTRLFIESALWPYEIDSDEVKKSIDDLTDKQQKAKSYREYRMAKAQLALQFAKLKIKDKKL